MPRKTTYFPVFLDVRGKYCLVVGGGPVALGKTRGLAKCGARVAAVAPEFAPEFGRLVTVKKIRRSFRFHDLESPRPWLVVAATDDAALHEQIAAQCREKRIWVNVVDVPELCDFIYPAVLRRGPLTLAISTGGASPAAAKFLRRSLEAKIGKAEIMLARALEKSRAALKKMPMAARKKFLKGVMSPGWLKRLEKSGAMPLVRHIRRAVK